MKSNKRKEVIRAIWFGLFSASAGIIEALLFELFSRVFHWTYWPSYLIALVASVLWNFTLNRNVTFKSATNVPIAMLKVALFYVVFTPVTTLGGDFLTTKLGWINEIVLALTMALNFVLEYLYDRFFVFGKSLDTRKTGKERLEENKE